MRATQGPREALGPGARKGGAKMVYEYMVVQMAAGGRVTHLNERLAAMVAEGWEPMMMCGDNSVSVMLRRAAKPAAAAAPQVPVAPQA
jgi:hypothetical protein